MLVWLLNSLITTAVAAEVPDKLSHLVPLSFSADAGTELQMAWNDPTLSDLLSEAYAMNPDLSASKETINIAQAQANLSRAALLPVVALEGSWSEAPTDGLMLGIPNGSTTPDTYQSRTAGIGASLQLDLFGTNTMAWQSARHTAKASEADAHAVTLTIMTAVANSWYGYLSALEQLQITRQQTQNEDGLLEVAELRYERGEVAMLEVLQQRQAAAAAFANGPTAQAAVVQRERNLKVLLGRARGEGELPSGQLPSIEELPPIGTPDQFIQRRPDLQSALFSLAAAKSARRSTWAAIAPTLGVQASFGIMEQYWDEWDNTDTWNIGASATMPLFTGGAALASLRASQASERVAEARLESIFHTAFAEVEIALANDTAAAERNAATQLQLNAASVAASEASSLYAAGLTTYINAASANSALFSAKMIHLQANLEQISTRLTLYQTLGGKIQ